MYTFDGTYYQFPGYKKPGCMFVLARDVRDNKFTILSQETAIIVVTEDSSVKIHQDGRVETIVKVCNVIFSRTLPQNLAKTPQKRAQLWWLLLFKLPNTPLYH